MTCSTDHLRARRPQARICFRNGFTILETILVVAIVSLLISLTLPAVQKIRARSSTLACQNNLRQLGLALHSYEGQHGRLPPESRISGKRREFYRSMSWMTLVLPYIEHTAVWQSALDAFGQTRSLQADPPHTAQRSIIIPFICHADDRLRRELVDSNGVTASFTSYLGVSGNMPPLPNRIRANGVLVEGDEPIRFADITDGASQTLMIGERPPDDGLLSGWWYRPHVPPAVGPDIVSPIESIDYADPGGCRASYGPDGVLYRFGPGLLSNPCDRFHFWSLHGGGANFAFADGSVRFMPYSAVTIMHALASRDGGESVDLP